MNNKLTTTIQQFGLDEKQAKVYLALLELGMGTVLDIAKKSAVGRVNVYYILGQLQEKGLVLTTHNKNKKMFKAANPKVLVSILESRAQQLKAALPELLSIQNTAENKPIIRYFEGKEGLKQIFEDMLDEMAQMPPEKRVILEYISPDSAIGELEKEQWNFIERRIKNKIKLRWIAPNTPLAREFKKHEKRDFREMRLVPTDKFKLLTEMNIYGNKLNLIAEKGEPVGLIMEHPEIVQTQREIFELAWHGAKVGNNKQAKIQEAKIK